MVGGCCILKRPSLAFMVGGLGSALASLDHLIVWGGGVVVMPTLSANFLLLKTSHENPKNKIFLSIQYKCTKFLHNIAKKERD